MRVDKRQILYQLVKQDLWENLSPEEIRLYLLLIVATDNKKGKGKLSLREINHCLDVSLRDVKKTMHNLQKLHLIKVEFCKEHSIRFQLLSP